MGSYRARSKSSGKRPASIVSARGRRYEPILVRLAIVFDGMTLTFHTAASQM